jgi:hypothetical protein
MDPARAAETIVARKPRRLRLDELLRELGARELPRDRTTDNRPAISVGELVDKAAEAGFGFLIAVLALIAIPFFGLSTPFGLAIALLGAQLLAGKVRPWLPQRARKRMLQMAMLDRVLAILGKRTKLITKTTRKRWEPMLRPRLAGLGIVLLALALALPLPIPGSNLIFLVPIFIYAIGLLEHDGVWVAIAHLATLVDMALLVVFGATVLAVLERLWHWLV